MVEFSQDSLVLAEDFVDLLSNAIADDQEELIPYDRQAVSVIVSKFNDLPDFYPDNIKTPEGELDLRKVNFEGADMQEIDFSKVCLQGCSLKKAKLDRVALFSLLPKAKAKKVDLRRVNLEKANLQGERVHRPEIGMSRFIRFDLQGLNLSGVNLKQAHLGGANLDHSNLRRANLKGAILDRAKARYTNFQEANLTGADLGLADMTGANLTDASLRKANLNGINLTNADLIRTEL